MTFHEHDHPRAGGGRFTAKEHAPADGVTLQEPASSGPAALFEAALGNLGASHIRVVRDEDEVTVSAAFGSDPLERKVDISIEDGAKDVDIRVWAFALPDRRVPSRSRRRVPLPSVADAESAAVVVADLKAEAAMQVAFTKHVDQRQATARHSGPALTTRVRITDGRTTVRLTEMSSSGHSSTSFDLDDFGQITGGEVRTGFGTIRLTGDSVDDMAALIHGRLLGAPTGTSGDGSRDGLQAMFTAATTAAHNDEAGQAHE